MAEWLRRLADMIEQGDGTVTVSVGSIEYASVDVTSWGDTMRQYVHTGAWTAHLTIHGAAGTTPPGGPALPPPKLTDGYPG